MFRMRVKTIRSVLWLGNLVVAAGVGVALLNIVQQHRKGTLTDWLDVAEIERRAKAPGTIQAAVRKNDLAEWPAYGALWNLNVTGKEPPPEVEVSTTTTDTVTASMKPIEEVLEVLFVAAWTELDEQSRPMPGHYVGSAQVYYLEDGDRSLGQPPGIGSRGAVGLRGAVGVSSGEAADPKKRSDPKTLDTFIKIGDELRAPYNAAPFFGKVLGIGADGVRFQWGEEEVVLATPKMDNANVGGLSLMGGIGPDGKPIPGVQLEAGTPKEPAKRESYKISDNAYFIGADEVERIESGYEALVAEIGVRNKYIKGAGEDKGRLRLVIDKVPEGSLVYQRGFREGDVLRTVNGEVIQSKASVVSYFKRNPTAKAFTIEIERLGAVMKKSFTVAR